VRLLLGENHGTVLCAKFDVCPEELCGVLGLRGGVIRHDDHCLAAGFDEIET
jgi:hypothetical protein